MPNEKLEPYEGKLSSTVLRGGNGSNVVLLPDQTVENKQKFISQIMTSKSPVRSCEDVDETSLSYAEIKVSPSRKNGQENQGKNGLNRRKTAKS